MFDGTTIATQVEEDGFAILEQVYTREETDRMIRTIEAATGSGSAFRKAGELYAIRRLLPEVPELTALLFTPGLRQLIHRLFGTDYFVGKSIYFDKPPASNWFVASHQDLTISVQAKADVPGFGPWTVKPAQFAVQPPLPLLERNFTIRVHLDDTFEQNGALSVVPASHRKGILRSSGTTATKGVACTVHGGGIMLLRPLLLHASSRTTNNRRRRVIHLEFSNSHLPAPLQWAEQVFY